MARRDLSPDDLKTWRFVTRTVAPLHEAALREALLNEAPRHPAADQASDKPAHPRVSVEPPPRAVPRPAPLKLGSIADIDRRTAQRFTRGEMQVDGRIDLHGLTLDQAHGALNSYMRAAAARAARCVIVVTGKGKGDGIGKIRAEVPHWLNQAPLRGLVLAVSQARLQHGGAGALYVLLKRAR